MIQEKNKIYQLYLKNKSNMLATKLETLQNLIYETLVSCKSKYYENISKKLCSKAIIPKYCWSLLKTMLNDKKVSCIPPIFYDKKCVKNFSKKANLSNSFFVKQCLVIENNVSSPHQLIPLPISTCQKLNLRRIILIESSVNSILS